MGTFVSGDGANNPLIRILVSGEGAKNPLGIFVSGDGAKKPIVPRRKLFPLRTCSVGQRTCASTQHRYMQVTPLGERVPVQCRLGGFRFSVSVLNLKF